MPIHLEWDSTLPAILYYRMAGQWNWDEYFKASEREFEMVASLGRARYDVVADFLKSNHIPVGAGVSHVNRVNQRRRQLQPEGLVIVVTRNRFIINMVKVGQKVYPVGNENFHTAQSLAEALALIERSRSPDR
jgi:hypothetical protein